MRVLISGAGVAGPTLAWFLAKTGATITIVEKSSSILPHGQNVDIKGSAIKVVKKMGLLDQVRQYNTTEKGSQFINQKGQAFAQFPVKDGSRASLTSEFEILRADLATILYKATKDLPNVDYQFDTTVKEVISNNDNSVKVELSNGEVRESDLLVAADGQWSKLRKSCFPPESVEVVDTGMIAVYWTILRQATDNDWWNIYLALKSRIITLRPDPYGTIRAMFTCMPRTEAQKSAWREAARGDKKTQEELLKREFADAGWQAQRLLDAIDKGPDFYFHVIQQIRMSKWSNSRVVCVGDAGYAPSPLSGGGTSLALTGAYVLAGELSKLEKGEHISKALEAYENAFRPFVEKIQDIPTSIAGFAHPETAWKRGLFHLTVRALSKVAASPWMAKRGGNTDDDDFVLPEYPCF